MTSGRIRIDLNRSMGVLFHRDGIGESKIRRREEWPEMMANGDKTGIKTGTKSVKTRKEDKTRQDNLKLVLL